MRGLLCGLLDESFGCGGPTLASELGQSQLSDVIQRTRVQWELFDYSNRPRTVSNAKRVNVTEMLSAAREGSTRAFQRGASRMAFSTQHSASLAIADGLNADS